MKILFITCLIFYSAFATAQTKPVHEVDPEVWFATHKTTFHLGIDIFEGDEVETKGYIFDIPVFVDDISDIKNSEITRPYISKNATIPVWIITGNEPTLVEARIVSGPRSDEGWYSAFVTKEVKSYFNGLQYGFYYPKNVRSPKIGKVTRIGHLDGAGDPAPTYEIEIH